MCLSIMGLMSEKGASCVYEMQGNFDLKRLLRKGSLMASNGGFQILRIGAGDRVMEINSFCVSSMSAL